MKKFIFIIFLLTFCCSLCYAQEHEITIGYAPYCKHIFNNSPDYNEEINAIAFSYDNWFLITFENSNYNRTFAIGYDWRTSKYHIDKIFLRGNLFLGLMHGYEDEFPNIGGVSPAIAPTIEMGYKNFSIHTMIVPVAALMFSYTF